jgi:hypothetical protein
MERKRGFNIIKLKTHLLKIEKIMKSIISKIFLIFFFTIIFSYGVIVGVYKIFPYNILQSINHNFLNVSLNQPETLNQLTIDEEFLNYAFTKEVSQKHLGGGAN